MTDGTLELLPLRANHAPGLDALIYVFRRGGKSILIANDTGWLCDESWKLLEGMKLDAAVIESTGGTRFAATLRPPASLISGVRKLFFPAVTTGETPMMTSTFGRSFSVSAASSAFHAAMSCFARPASSRASFSLPRSAPSRARLRK